MSTPLFSPELATDWARCERWATLCTVGRCVYADLGGSHAGPLWRSRDSDELCPGYAGVLHAEGDRQTIRVRECRRRAAWWKRRQQFIRDQRQAQRESEQRSARR